MTTDHDALTQYIEDFVAAFNRGDAAALNAMYYDDAVLVPAPGQPLTGGQRRAAQAHLLSFGVPMEAKARHIYISGDIAHLIVDWTIKGTMPDGTEIDLKGTATDIARKNADGKWLYVVDNPFGVA